MDRLTPFLAPEHDILAAPLRDQQLGDTGFSLLGLLVVVGVVLFLALRATLGGIAALLAATGSLTRSAFTLGKWLLVVVGLIVAVGAGLVGGADDGGGPGPTIAPTTPAAPEPLTRLHPADPTR